MYGPSGNQRHCNNNPPFGSPPSCFVPGRCQGVFIDFGTEPSPNDCLANCKVSTRLEETPLNRVASSSLISGNRGLRVVHPRFVQRRVLHLRDVLRYRRIVRHLRQRRERVLPGGAADFEYIHWKPLIKLVVPRTI